MPLAVANHQVDGKKELMLEKQVSKKQFAVLIIVFAGLQTATISYFADQISRHNDLFERMTSERHIKTARQVSTNTDAGQWNLTTQQHVADLDEQQLMEKIAQTIEIQLKKSMLSHSNTASTDNDQPSQDTSKQGIEESVQEDNTALQQQALANAEQIFSQAQTQGSWTSNDNQDLSAVINSIPDQVRVQLAADFYAKLNNGEIQLAPGVVPVF